MRVRFKNDQERRVAQFAGAAQAFMPEKDIQQLTRATLDYLITELRNGETNVRRLRKRLEALRDQSERPCPVCDRPVTGRPDAIYCNAACRIKAHRQARRDGNT